MEEASDPTPQEISPEAIDTNSEIVEEKNEIPVVEPIEQEQPIQTIQPEAQVVEANAFIEETPPVTISVVETISIPTSPFSESTQQNTSAKIKNSPEFINISNSEYDSDDSFIQDTEFGISEASPLTPPIVHTLIIPTTKQKLNYGGYLNTKTKVTYHNAIAQTTTAYDIRAAVKINLFHDL